MTTTLPARMPDLSGRRTRHGGWAAAEIAIVLATLSLLAGAFLLRC